jgi:hypothetical protein
MELTPIPTVAIAADNEQGWKLINAEEFDPNIHTRYEGEPSDTEAPSPGEGEEAQTPRRKRT